LKEFKAIKYHVFSIDFNSDSVVFGWKDGNGDKFSSLAKFNESLGNNALMLTNGGMFHPNYTSVGLYIEKGINYVPVDTGSGKGNFYLKPNGVFGLDHNGFWVGTTNRYLETKPQLTNATQSGPMLIADNQIHSGFGKASKNLNIRSGVGVDSSGRAYMVLSSKPVNFYDFATFFKIELKCSNALYLDGYISKMTCEEAQLFGDGDFGCMIAVLKKRK
jgi:uncharacterized protein YigE (DUF2233 family)